MASSGDEDSSGQSDEDYCPIADSDRQTQLSEEDESGNDSNVSADHDDGEHDRARKTTKTKSRKRKHATATKQTTPAEDVAAKPLANDDGADAEQKEKARADALWADFLFDSDASSTQPKVAAGTTATASTVLTQPPVKKRVVVETVEYAGEKIEITKEVAVQGVATPTPQSAKSIVPASTAPASSSNTSRATTTATTGVVKKLTPGPSRRGFASNGNGGSGLSAILSQMNKTKKIGTLEKTKLDWNSFKRNEGIEEQLQTHNRGKDGYLDRQDFLQRTDLRQFEREKDLRQTSRRGDSNR